MRFTSHRRSEHPGMCDMRVGRIGHCGHRECPVLGHTPPTPITPTVTHHYHPPRTR